MGVLGKVASAVRNRPAQTSAAQTGHDFLLEFEPGVDPERAEDADADEEDADAERAGEEARTRGGSGKARKLKPGAVTQRQKHQLAACVLQKLRRNGLDVRRVRASRCDARAYALRGRFEVLLRQAEKMRLRKPLREGMEQGKSALFVTARLADFADSDDPDALFPSGERLMLLEPLVTEDPVMRAARGLRNEPGLSPDDALGGAGGSAGIGSGGGSGGGAGGVLADIVLSRGARRAHKPPRIVSVLTPLHDPQEADRLARRWIRRVGAQPLDEVLRYFGHLRAFYFAFLGSYSFWLTLPAAVGVAVFREQRSTGRFDDGLTLGFLLFMSLWASAFLEYWKRRQAALAFRWDALEFEAVEERTRPEFMDRATPRYHPLAGEYQWFYPGWRRAAAVLLSFAVCSGVAAAACAAMTALLVLDARAALEWAESDAPLGGALHLSRWLPLAGYMGVVQVTSLLGHWLAETLTDLENHRTQTEYRNARIVKLAALQFFAFHVSPLYIAFLEQDMDKLFRTVAALLGMYQVLGQLAEMGLPLLRAAAAALCAQRGSAKARARARSKSGNAGAQLPQEQQGQQQRDQPEEQAAQEERANAALPSVGAADVLLAEPEEIFSEYLELWVQFGQVVLFSAVFPLAPLLALLNNALELRGDAFKMLRLERRSVGERVSGIGAWQEAFEVIGYAAVACNVALVGIMFNDSALGRRWLEGWSPAGKLLLLVAVEHGVVALKYALASAVPDVSADIAFLVRARALQAQLDGARQFEMRARCQELLVRDRKQFAFRDSLDQGQQLLRVALQQPPPATEAGGAQRGAAPGPEAEAGGTRAGGTDGRAAAQEGSLVGGNGGSESSGSGARAGEAEAPRMAESLLFQWIADQEERRRRAERQARHLRHQAEAGSVPGGAAPRFKELPQTLNIAATAVAVVLLLTREARQAMPWGTTEEK